MADATAPVSDETAAMLDLIQQTDTLNPAEKEYWINLVPQMDAAQLDQLKGILQTEQKHLEEIDQKYDGKLEAVSQKYLNQWDAQKTREERFKRQQEEEASQESAHEEAEKLLEQW